MEIDFRFLTGMGICKRCGETEDDAYFWDELNYEERMCEHCMWLEAQDPCCIYISTYESR